MDPLAVDGTFNKTDKSAHSTIAIKEKNNLRWRCRWKESSLHAELEAIERAIAIAPIDERIDIFSDCKSALCEYRSYKFRINKLLAQRKAITNKPINLIWVPSHTQDNTRISTEKNKKRTVKDRIIKLESKYGKETTTLILNMNKVADTLARGSTLKKNNIETPEGLPEIAISIYNEVIEGNFRKNILNTQKSNFSDIVIIMKIFSILEEIFYTQHLYANTMCVNYMKLPMITITMQYALLFLMTLTSLQ
jgi:hypothetical protein